MIKVGYFKCVGEEGQIVNSEPEKIAFHLPMPALDLLITHLSYNGFVLECDLVSYEGFQCKSSKQDTFKIAVVTHCLGPIKTPYVVSYEGNFEEEGSGLLMVTGWFIKARKSASPELLKQYS
jgi:hypothetical protein